MPSSAPKGARRLPYLPMPHGPMRFASVLLALNLLTACAPGDSKVTNEIARKFKQSGGKSINLVEAVPSSWEKVCILGPYSNNKVAEEVLGFSWDVEARTSILLNEGISLLLFVRGKEVVESKEHPRGDGDFSNLTRKCFARENAIFIHDPNPSEGWPGLFPSIGHSTLLQ